MIRAANVPLGAGKTYQSARKAAEDIKKGKSTLLFAPTHAAGREFIGMIPAELLGDSYVVHLRGKSEETCLEAYTARPCTRCPVFKVQYGGDQLSAELEVAARGGIMTHERLMHLASQYGICSMLAGRLLAQAKTAKVVVAAHAYLGSKTTMNTLRGVKVDQIIIDEADNLFEVLLENSRRELILALPRQNLAYTVREECNGRCVGCIPHMVDMTGGRVTAGKIESLDGIDNHQNTVDMLMDAVNLVENACREGLIKDLFDFSSIREMISAISDRLPASCECASMLDYLRSVEAHNSPNRILIDERSEASSDFAVPIPVRAVASESYESLLQNCELTSPMMRSSVLRKLIFTDEVKSVEKWLHNAVETFIRLVDFLHGAPEEIYMLPEKHPIGMTEGGPPRCRLTVQYLDESHYRNVREYLKGRTRMLSGTLLSARMVAANLLLPLNEVDLVSCDVPFHNSALIIVHNHTTPTQIKPVSFPPWAYNDLYRAIQAMIPDIKILHFSTNTLKAGAFFRLSYNRKDLVERFRIELRHADYIQGDLASSGEVAIDDRSALLVVDKLRSPTARAVNRDSFNLCVVAGNGVADWSARIPLFLAARKLHEDLTLEDLIAYEQRRAVIQALMRAPRSAGKTVCLYCGNIHPMAFPPFLRNRIVTTQELVDLYRAEVEEVDGQNVKDQVVALAHGVVKFLNDGSLNITRSTLEVDGSILNRWPGRRSTAEKRLRHIDTCIARKGYVEKEWDRMGTRTDWNFFLVWLEEQKYIKRHTEGRKVVYIPCSSQ
ncbi:MAG: hypothetical protein HQK54_10425 [Oligoflexales bacterium]|nr:hypothetical protein [Oligoflexales bacterium]